MISRVRAVIATAALAFIASCGTSSPGEPVPGPNTAERTSTQSTSAEPTTERATTLADMSPCDLLTSDDRQTLGVTKVEGEAQTGSARICTAHTAAGTTSTGIRTNAGLDGVRASNATETRVGSHDAKIAKNSAAGGCTVYIGVSDSSRVDVVSVDRQGDVEESCALAERTAGLVEKNLPES
ncbi:DUF3558 family protein [Actinokineospora fastidiosa]|uniref:DUF3558 domain-containing protein n=1 Tax=Actinokineospora fastidiosa TaxID=1816 RepID=A0A918GFY3_9PSEU|nr:DUF3558 family protein [Actinokineospora fastidiosa]GGS33857.1 hypothetical protein GCM10010171_30200 [Actinokineospora fastidiosa]